jgi:hypothetical protein
MVNPFLGVKRFWMVRAERVKYFGLLALSFGIGATGASWPWEQTRTTEVLRAVAPKVAEALMIAPILALMVDEAAKRKLLREFAVDVSSNIIGRHLPVSMREAVREYLSVSVIRSRWLVTYTITEIPSSPGYVKLHTRSEWELANRLEKSQACPLRFEVEKSWFPEVGETEITRLGFEDPYGIGSFDYRKGDERLGSTLQEGYWVVKGKPITLGPHPHPAFKCWAECDEVYPSNYSTPFVAALPVESLTVKVKYPDGRFKVGLQLSFEDSIDNPSRSPGEVLWELSKPMLVGHAFYTTWLRTDTNKRAAARGEATEESVPE